MAARRALRGPTDDVPKTQAARARVEAAKRALGERGPVWWDDGAPDYNRRKVASTPYAEWFAAVAATTPPAHGPDAGDRIGPPSAVGNRES